MNGVGFVLTLAAFGGLVFAGLCLRDARRVRAEAEEMLQRAEHLLTCTEEFV